MIRLILWIWAIGGWVAIGILAYLYWREEEP